MFILCCKKCLLSSFAKDICSNSSQINDVLEKKVKLFSSTIYWWTRCQLWKDYLFCTVQHFTQI